MAHPYHHALSSVKKWGGIPEDYQPIHDWFDATKAFIGDARHRLLRHHAEGIFLCEDIFGSTLTTSWDRVVPIRWIGEQHVIEDMGFIPSVSWWFEYVQYNPAMNPRVKVESTPFNVVID